MGNGYGEAHHSRDADFAAYDRLPPLARGMLQRAAANWSSPFILQIWSEAIRAGASPEVCFAALVRKLSGHSAADAYRTYGPDHPQSDAQGKRLKPDQHGLWRPAQRARRAS